MAVFQYQGGMPRVVAEKTAIHRSVNYHLDYLPGGVVLNGTKTRDPSNDTIKALRGGLVLGKITATGKYANSFLGLTAGSLTNSGTSLTLTTTAATELVRRVGSTGTFTLTGPPTAAGTVRSMTVTYSAVNTGTGVVTITALGVNEVQTVNLSTAATGGSIRLLVSKTDGTMALTPAAAWSATDATLLSNLNTALDTATGVSGGIVATAIAATDTDLGFVLTYSGTGYAGNTWALAQVDTLFTSNTGANVVRTTTGVDGRFVTASLVGDTDGSQTPAGFIPTGWGEFVDEDGNDLPLNYFPVRGVLDSSQLLVWPSDSSLKTWIRDKLNVQGKFTYTDAY